jgi:hypothetical protein
MGTMIATLGLLVTLLGTSQPALMQCPGAIYVVVGQKGDVQINGKPIAGADVASELEKLKSSSRFVMYYRENPSAEPSAEEWSRIRGVLNEVVKLRLPISLSSKTDFSDYVDGQGNSHPRTHCGPQEAG